LDFNLNLFEREGLMEGSPKLLLEVRFKVSNLEWVRSVQGGGRGGAYSGFSPEGTLLVWADELGSKELLFDFQLDIFWKSEETAAGLCQRKMRGEGRVRDREKWDR
jgi:hypothetical protein